MGWVLERQLLRAFAFVGGSKRSMVQFNEGHVLLLVDLTFLSHLCTTESAITLNNTK